MGEETVEIIEVWKKDDKGVGTLYERYYMNSNGEKENLPVTSHQEIQFVQYSDS